MSRKITAANIFDTVDIDLWGNQYTLRQITKSVSERLKDAQDNAEKVDEETAKPDEVAATLIAVVDILLEPAADTQPAGELLTGLWEEDKLGLDWLNAFAETVQEEGEARRRPTSPSTTSA